METSEKAIGGFKLLAIRILPNTDKRFRKNLKEGMVYKFYQNYSYKDDRGDEISESNNNLSEIHFKITKQEGNIDLYSNGDVSINISAIVGENGSGKSSIIDNLNLIHYYLSVYHFKTIQSSMDSSLNKMRMLANFTVEYINVVSDFFKDENSLEFEEYKKVNFGLLPKDQILEILNSIDSFLYTQSLIQRANVSSMKGDRSGNLRTLIWKYITEGIDHKFIFETPLLSESLVHIFEFLHNKLRDFIKSIQNTFTYESEFEKDLKENFNFQLVYEKGADFVLVEKIKEKVSPFSDPYFYTIHLNYSLHSLNSNNIGGWIDKLFHKNDGYQTPIVINPIRENGNININKESDLAINRILNNIIDSLNNSGKAILIEKYEFDKFILKLNPKKAPPSSFEDINQEIDITDKIKVLKYLVNPPLSFSRNRNILDYTIGYTIKKFRKITNTYMFHFYEYDSETNSNFQNELDNFQDWLNLKSIDYVSNNITHVTQKFYRAYNFLLNYEKLIANLPFIDTWDLTKDIELTKDNLIDWIKYLREEIGGEDKKVSTETIMLNLFPSIFDVDIEFKTSSSNVKFSDLSSGEQQYLFNLNTIVYHINNLKTIVPIEDEQSKQRNYEHVNIVLDEIELYYHPQYQKNFVRDICNSIKNTELLNRVRSFNIMFLTHSPFILSDLISDNILRLKDGSPDYGLFNQTFGANIHELLHNEFFLKDGFIGSHAKERIQSVIDFLKSDSLESKEWNKENSFDFINVIGEDLIRNTLLEIYYEKFSDKLDEQIKRLMSLKKR